MSGKKTTSQFQSVREQTRGKALQMLPPNLLASVEDAGEAYAAWQQAQAEADRLRAEYERAFYVAVDSGWTVTQLKQMDLQRPARTGKNARTPAQSPTSDAPASSSESPAGDVPAETPRGEADAGDEPAPDSTPLETTPPT